MSLQDEKAAALAEILAVSRNYCIDVSNASVAAILCDGKIKILTQE
jgi:hypothetical protein